MDIPTIFAGIAVLLLIPNAVYSVYRAVRSLNPKGTDSNDG